MISCTEDNMKYFRISIITINYNNSEGLYKTLKSVERQITSEKFEHIIIDGASSDCSLLYLKKYSEHNKYVTWSSTPDEGIYHAMNKGLKMSSGDYVFYLNSGDCLSNSSVLESIIDALKVNSPLDIIYGDLHVVGGSGEVERQWVTGDFKKWKVYYGWMFPHPMTGIRRTLLQKYHGFDQSFDISADYDLMLKIVLGEKLKCEYIKTTLTKMEAGGLSNRNLSQVFKANIEVLRSWKKQKNIFIPVWIFVTKPVSKLLQYKNFINTLMRK